MVTSGKGSWREWCKTRTMRLRFCKEILRQGEGRGNQVCRKQSQRILPQRNQCGKTSKDLRKSSKLPLASSRSHKSIKWRRRGSSRSRCSRPECGTRNSNNRHPLGPCHSSGRLRKNSMHSSGSRHNSWRSSHSSGSSGHNKHNGSHNSSRSSRGVGNMGGSKSSLGNRSKEVGSGRSSSESKGSKSSLSNRSSKLTGRRNRQVGIGNIVRCLAACT
mmetsp:Transcript_47757/g.111378  ORF Transcript_47757/g.111378 Transcript_47757/m.111378 type:complete len:217 (+) Transcript_47757:1690-2340(+)